VVGGGRETPNYKPVTKDVYIADRKHKLQR